MMMAYAALDEMLLKLKYTRPIFNKPQIFSQQIQKIDLVIIPVIDNSKV